MKKRRGREKSVRSTIVRYISTLNRNGLLDRYCTSHATSMFLTYRFGFLGSIEICVFSLRIIFNLNMLKETVCDYTVAGFLAAAQCQTMRWERISRIFGIIQCRSIIICNRHLSVADRSVRRCGERSLTFIRTVVKHSTHIAVIVAYWHWERLVGGRCWWWWWGSGTIKAGCCLGSSPWRRPSHLAVILNLCLSTHVGNWFLLGTGTHLIP